MNTANKIVYSTNPEHLSEVLEQFRKVVDGGKVSFGTVATACIILFLETVLTVQNDMSQQGLDKACRTAEDTAKLICEMTYTSKTTLQ